MQLATVGLGECGPPASGLGRSAEIGDVRFVQGAFSAD